MLVHHVYVGFKFLYRVDIRWEYLFSLYGCRLYIKMEIREYDSPIETQNVSTTLRLSIDEQISLFAEIIICILLPDIINIEEGHDPNLESDIT